MEKFERSIAVGKKLCEIAGIDPSTTTHVEFQLVVVANDTGPAELKITKLLSTDETEKLVEVLFALQWEAAE